MKFFKNLKDLKCITDKSYDKLLQMSDEVGKVLSGFIKKLKA